MPFILLHIIVDIFHHIFGQSQFHRFTVVPFNKGSLLLLHNTTLHKFRFGFEFSKYNRLVFNVFLLISVNRQLPVSWWKYTKLDPEKNHLNAGVNCTKELMTWNQINNCSLFINSQILVQYMQNITTLKEVWINNLLCICAVRIIHSKVNTDDFIKRSLVKCNLGLWCKESNTYKFFWPIILGPLFLVISIATGGFGLEAWDEASNKNISNYFSTFYKLMY